MSMRVLLLCLSGLIAASSAHAEIKLSTKPANANEVRYFTSIDGLMDGNADVILKESRQGRAVTSAVLDLCYPVSKGSDRRDRFVVDLTANGQTLSGSTQTLGDKLPVTVNLTQRPTGDTFEFKGKISVGPNATDVSSSDNSDLSEREFGDNQSTDDGIVAAPKDFSEVSPEAVAVRIKLDKAADFLKGLKGQELEVSTSGLAVSCDALRSGEQTINITVAPERAAELIAKAKSMPGVVNAGWTTGVVEMDRTIRFAAADWRDGDHLNKDRLAASVANVLAKTLAAKTSSTVWDANNGKLKLTFARPSQIYPTLDLTDTITVDMLIAPDKPGGSDRLMVWVGAPEVTTTDQSAGPKLNLADDSSSDEEADPKDDNGAVDALAREFKAQRWDPDRSAWK
jgi:hypothetical protein